MTRPLRIESPDFRPGELRTFVTLHFTPWPEQPDPDAALLVTITPDVKAFFAIERWDVLSAREARQLYQGKLVVTGGVLLRAKSMASTTRSFVGNLHLVANADAIAQRAALVADRDWRAAYDRAIAALRGRVDTTDADRRLIELASATHVPPASSTH